VSKKINIIQKSSENLARLAEQAGILLMTAAAVTGMLELPDHPNNKIIVPGQPSFTLASENDELNNPIRREKEESEPHFAGYSITRRTPSKATSH